MKRIKTESGTFHPLFLLAVVVVAALIGLAAWRVIKDNPSSSSTSTTTSIPAAPTATTPIQAPGSITKPADLNMAKASLNQINLDNDLNPNSLSADISSLL